MSAEGFIFLAIVGLIFAVQLLRWAVHKHRNKALGLPDNAELTKRYDPGHMPPPAVGDEPEPGRIGPHMFGGGGWQAPAGDMNQPRRDRD